MKRENAGLEPLMIFQGTESTMLKCDFQHASLILLEFLRFFRIDWLNVVRVAGVSPLLDRLGR